jgi:abortive infection bacteriophage resistance protein
MQFNKPPLTYEKQLEQLIQRGLKVKDSQNALHYLEHLNYYRLAAYWWPFQSNVEQHTFKPGASFEKALDRYRFDRELRLLILDAIERIEVSLRTGWAYRIGHTYGSHGILDSNIFKIDSAKWRYQEQLCSLQLEVDRSKEGFIAHFRENYDEPIPPVWALVEVMSLGQLSKWFVNLKRRSDRQAIARRFRVDEEVLCSFLHHLTFVRNICAHHSRLWNREFTFIPKLPRHRPAALISQLNPRKKRRIYNTLQILAFFMDLLCPNHSWRKRLHDLIENQPDLMPHMGFPVGFDLVNFKTPLAEPA